MSSPTSQPDALLAELERLPPAARLRRVQADGPAADVILSLADRAMALMHTESERALSVSDLLVALSDDAGIALAQARARHARARALSYVGRFDDALASCHEAVEIATRGGHAVEAGRARLASMHALGELGRNDEAVTAGHRAREEFLSVDATAFVARADINLGIIHQRRDQPAAALERLDRARPHLVDDPAVLGHLDNSRGEALLATYDFARAEQAFTAALAAFEQAEASMTAAIAEGNLADLAAREGRLSRALYFFESARRRLEATGSPAHLARLLAEQAEAKALLGLPADALGEYGVALPELDRCGLALEAARARGGMGRVLLRLDRVAEAETALAAAAIAFDELGHATARARVDLVRAELALVHGRGAESTRMAARALSVLHERPADAAAARHLLARCAIAAGELPAADADLAAAEAAAARLDLAPLLADILHTRGRLHLRRGMDEEAAADLGRAVACIERLRGSLQAERFRTAFLGDRAAVFEALVTAVLARSGADAVAEAFTVVEQSKSRALLDRVRGARDGHAPREHAGDAAETRMRTEVARVEAELNALYSRLADDDADATWPRAVREREAELATLESRLAASRERAWLYASPPTLAAVQACLADDELLLEYFVADGRVLVFAVERNDATVVRGLAPAADIATGLERLQFQIDRALRPAAAAGRGAARRLDEARHELGALDEKLLAPVRAQLATHRRLTVVPHGVLHLVPFHALWDGHRHVVETHEVSTVPSAALRLHLEGDGEGGGAPLVVGVADDLAPGMVAEAERAGTSLGCGAGRILTGERATVEQFTRLAPDAALIHVAAHGRYLPDNPFGSGLRLADRWLTLREVCGLELRADLVTLSGCETGLNSVHAGDELIGLQRAFFVAEARALLVSLWRVDDESASCFMSRLYERWPEGGHAGRDRRTLVHAAQLAMLAERPHPAYWAPFTLVGMP